MTDGYRRHFRMGEKRSFDALPVWGWPRPSYSAGASSRGTTARGISGGPEELKHFRLKIPRPGRPNADHADVIDLAASQLWKDAPRQLRTVTRMIDGRPAELKFDWSSVAEYHLRHYELEGSMGPALYALPESELDERFSILDALTPATVAISSDAEHANVHGVAEVVQDLFLALNLACPGSLNLYRAELAAEDDSYVVELDLSSDVFETAWIDSIRGAPVTVGPLELSSVQSWLGGCHLDASELASSGTNRALFCLLHLSTSWHWEPTALLWVSHALEALFHVPNALSFSFLRDRMYLLLELPNSKRKRTAKELREFFDARNAFAHGGMEIARPHASSVGEGPLWDLEGKLMDRLGSGSRMVVASIQRMIQLGLNELHFQESLTRGPT